MALEPMGWEGQGAIGPGHPKCLSWCCPDSAAVLASHYPPPSPSQVGATPCQAEHISTEGRPTTVFPHQLGLSVAQGEDSRSQLQRKADTSP